MIDLLDVGIVVQKGNKVLQHCYSGGLKQS